MFVGKAWSGVESLSGASFGCALALPANIRLGWKSLPGTNPPAYYENSQLTAIKRFITLALAHNYEGKLPALPANIRLEWKLLAVRKTL
jgi:hypothetical protein